MRYLIRSGIMEIKFFDNKIESFIDSLDRQVIARLLRALDLLLTFGHELGMPHSKKVASRLFELRVRGKQEIRIFYAFHSGAAVLLHGFIKKSQRTPKREIEMARQKLKALDGV